MLTLLPTTVLSFLLLASPAATAPATTSAVNPVGPAERDVDQLIAEGRTLLDAGQPVPAEAVFQRAAEEEGGSPRTEVWILRAWMDQGRTNDTLDRIDALRKEGLAEPELDYLYGMAFVRRAEQNLANGVTDASIQMNFEDGVEFLSRAVEADPERYRDAFLPLGRAAWHALRLDVARRAIDRAVGFYPRDGATHLMKGRIALSQFQVAKGEDPIAVADWSDEVEAQWRAAHHAFSAAVKGFGNPRTDTGKQYLLALSAVQLGHTLVWKGMREEAAAAFATALAWAPYTVDLGQVRGFLADWNAPKPLDMFLDALQQGEEGFVANFGPKNPGDATLLWWLGYTQFERAFYKAAEEAFLASMAKQPAYTDVWFYVGMCRFNRVEYGEAVAALRIGWALDPVTMIRVMQSGDQGYNLARLSSIADWCIKQKKHLEAATLWEINAETAETNSMYWDYAGLFLRDAGDDIVRKQEAPDKEYLRELWERSYAAYQRALSLDPANPQLLNDTAVLLHYYLHRDLDKAMAMYQRAEERATELLASESLSDDLRSSYETALEDSRNNQVDLAARIAKQKGPEAEETAQTEAPSTADR